MAEFAIYLGSPKGALALLGTAVVLLFFVGFIVCKSGRRPKLEALLLDFFFIELSFAFILLSFGFDEMAEIDSNPQLVPMLWGCSLFACSILQFIRIWRRTDYKPAAHGHIGKVAAVIAIVVAAIAAFKQLGFFISTGSMIVALMFLMGERRKLLMAATACVWMAMTWLIFNKLLLLGLPTGSLFVR